MQIHSEKCTEQHHVGGAGCEQSKRQCRVNLSAGDLVLNAHGSRSIRRFYPGVCQDIFSVVHKSFTTHPPLFLASVSIVENTIWLPSPSKTWMRRGTAASHRPEASRALQPRRFVRCDGAAGRGHSSATIGQRHLRRACRPIELILTNVIVDEVGIGAHQCLRCLDHD